MDWGGLVGCGIFRQRYKIRCWRQWADQPHHMFIILGQCNPFVSAGFRTKPIARDSTCFRNGPRGIAGPSRRCVRRTHDTRLNKPWCQRLVAFVRFRNCAVRGNGRAQGPDTRTGEAVHVDPDQPDLLRRRVVLPDLPTTCPLLPQCLHVHRTTLALIPKTGQTRIQVCN